MLEVVIIITLISSSIVTPLLTYLINSRCTTIKTPCCTIERDVIKDKNINLDNLKSNNKNKNDKI